MSWIASHVRSGSPAKYQPRRNLMLFSENRAAPPTALHGMFALGEAPAGCCEAGPPGLGDLTCHQALFVNL